MRKAISHRIWPLALMLSPLVASQADTAKLRQLMRAPALQFTVAGDSASWASGLASDYAGRIAKQPTDWRLRAKASALLDIAGEHDGAKTMGAEALKLVPPGTQMTFRDEPLVDYSAALLAAEGTDALRAFLGTIAKDADKSWGYWLALAQTRTFGAAAEKEDADKAGQQALESRNADILKAWELAPDEGMVRRAKLTYWINEAVLTVNLTDRPLPSEPKLADFVVRKSVPDYELGELLIALSAVQALAAAKGFEIGKPGSQLEAMRKLGDGWEPLMRGYAKRFRELVQEVPAYLQPAALEYAYVATFFEDDRIQAAQIVEDWAKRFPDSRGAALAELTLGTLDDDRSRVASRAASIADAFPNDPEVQLKSGKCLEKDGRIDAAIACVRRAGSAEVESSTEKFSPIVDITLAALLLKQGNAEADKEADSILERLADGDVPEELREDFVYTLGLYLGIIGVDEKAKELLQSLVNAFPDKPEYKEALAAIG